jgi:type IV secretory pathway VirB2 component (pilin)
MQMNFKNISLKAIVANVRGRVTRNGLAAKAAIKSLPKQITWRHAYMGLWLAGYAGLAAAQTVGDGSAPWDSSLCGVAGWFKGTTMIAIGTVAFGAAGAGFLFGEELTGIMKKVVNIIMAVGLAVGGSSILGWIAVKMGAAKQACGV